MLSGRVGCHLQGHQVFLRCSHEPKHPKAEGPMTTNRHQPPTANRQPLKYRRSHNQEAESVSMSVRLCWCYEGSPPPSLKDPPAPSPTPLHFDSSLPSGNQGIPHEEGAGKVFFCAHMYLTVIGATCRLLCACLCVL